MKLTEEKILEIRDEIVARCNANDRMFDKFFKNVPAKHKAKFPELEHEFIDFFYNNLYYKPKDVNIFLRSLYEREILTYPEEREL